MNDESLRYLTDERRRERECDAERERLAVHARCRPRPGRAQTPVAGLAFLFAVRRQAIQ